MTALNYLTIATALCSIAMSGYLIVRPSVGDWKRSTVRALGGTTALLCVLTLVLTLMQSHGKA
jgi:hypothetical protein